MAAHGEIEERITRRIETLETDHKQSLTRIYEKLEIIQREYSTRPPLWATTLITLLSTICGALLMKVLH